MGNCFGRLRSSTVRRATESRVSEKRQLTVEAEHGSRESSQVSKNAQNDHELQSFDDKAESPIDKNQPLGKEQSPTDMPDSEQPLQSNVNVQMKVLQTPTGNGNREQFRPKRPREQGEIFQEEFKEKAELARPKITSNLKFNYPTSLKGPHEPRSIHVLFTHEKNGSKVAGVVDLRDWKRVTGTLIGKLVSIRKAVLEMGYDRVYAYLYVNEDAKVSDGMKTRAEMQGIKIVRRDELSPDELTMEIDEKLQSACRSKIEPTVDIQGAGPTDAQNSDYTDHAPVTDHSTMKMCLSDKDHAKICNELADHAAKWRDIGGVLGFSEGELDNIQADQMLFAQFPPMSYLKKMVSQWLQWAPGDGRGSTDCATKESLVAALLKSNLGQLAKNINL